MRGLRSKTKEIYDIYISISSIDIILFACLRLNKLSALSWELMKSKTSIEIFFFFKLETNLGFKKYISMQEKWLSDVYSSFSLIELLFRLHILWGNEACAKAARL